MYPKAITRSWLEIGVLKSRRIPRGDLPGGQKEVESVALILNTIPLNGRQGTAAEVMRRISSVGVIHIAAFADRYTGEITPSPNPGWTSRFSLTEGLRRTGGQSSSSSCGLAISVGEAES